MYKISFLQQIIHHLEKELCKNNNNNLKEALMQRIEHHNKMLKDQETQTS